MHIKCHRRLKDGKEHRYWSIVESRRCSGGRIVQRHVRKIASTVNAATPGTYTEVEIPFDDEGKGYRGRDGHC